MKPRNLIASIAAIAGVAVVVCALYSRHAMSSSAKPSSESVSSSISAPNVPLPKGAVESNVAVATVDLEHTPSNYVPVKPAERAVSLPSAAVRAVLPSLASVPSDWRHYNPETITVNLAPGITVPFTRTAVRQSNGRQVWSGKSPVDGGELFAVSSEKGWVATATFLNGNEYKLFVSGDRASVTEAAPDDWICSNADDSASPYVNTAFSLPMPASPATPDANGVYTVDFVIFYDEDTVAKAADYVLNTPTSAEDYIVSRITSDFEASNALLVRSQVNNLRWNITGFFLIPAYSINGDTSMLTDLSVVSGTTTTAGQFVQAKMDELSADQAVVYIGTTRDFGGRAYCPGHHSVVMWGGPYTVVAHEAAHNYGCRHDRTTDAIPDSDTSYCFGHRWQDPSETVTDRGDVMSYAPNRVLYFSNPAISVNGYPVGIAAGQLRAADSARWLREHAAEMASYKSPMTAPVITTNPSNVTVTSGYSFSLSVVADGASLSYQWYHGGVAVAGATGATFSKTSTASDAGSYTVTVTNPKGTVTSNAATVTVNAAPPPTPSSGGGGGGGGGGAPGAYFYLALLLAGAARRFAKKS